MAIYPEITPGNMEVRYALIGYTALPNMPSFQRGVRFNLSASDDPRQQAGLLREENVVAAFTILKSTHDLKTEATFGPGLGLVQERCIRAGVFIDDYDVEKVELAKSWHNMDADGLSQAQRVKSDEMIGPLRFLCHDRLTVDDIPKKGNVIRAINSPMYVALTGGVRVYGPGDSLV